MFTLLRRLTDARTKADLLALLNTTSALRNPDRRSINDNWSQNFLLWWFIIPWKKVRLSNVKHGTAGGSSPFYFWLINHGNDIQASPHRLICLWACPLLCRLPVGKAAGPEYMGVYTCVFSRRKEKLEIPHIQHTLKLSFHFCDIWSEYVWTQSRQRCWCLIEHSETFQVSHGQC